MKPLFLLALHFALWSVSDLAEATPELNPPTLATSLQVKVGEEEFGLFETMSGAGSASTIIENIISTPDGGRNVRHLPGDLLFDSITLSRPLTGNQSAWTWRRRLETDGVASARQTVRIVGLNGQGQEMVTMTLIYCWPSALVLEQPATSKLPREALTIVMEGFLLVLRPELAMARGIISSPAQGAVYYVPQKLPVTVALQENADAAVRVRFFADDQVIGTDNDPADGFSLSWAAPTPGIYKLRAEVINAGDALVSTPLVDLRIKEQIQVGITTQAIAENLPIKTVVGIFNVSGTDDSTVTLAPGTGDSDNGSFSIDAVKRLITEKVFDRRSVAAVSFRVKAVANDGIGGVAERAFVIAVTDGPEDAGPRLTEDVELKYDATTNTSNVQLHFGHGIYGRSYTVQASENLEDWTTVGSYVADETGSIQAKDTAAGKPDRRFWRVTW